MSQHTLICKNYYIPLQPWKEHDTRTSCYDAHIDPTGTVHETLTRRWLPSDTFMSTLRCPVLTRVQKYAQLKYFDSRSYKSDANTSITFFLADQQTADWQMLMYSAIRERSNIKPTIRNGCFSSTLSKERLKASWDYPVIIAAYKILPSSWKLHIAEVTAGGILVSQAYPIGRAYTFFLSSYQHYTLSTTTQNRPLSKMFWFKSTLGQRLSEDRQICSSSS